MKLKRILHIKKYDIYHIKIKTNDQINYYKYLQRMKRIEIEVRIIGKELDGIIK